MKNMVVTTQMACVCNKLIVCVTIQTTTLKLLFHSVVHGEPCFEATRRFMHPASFAGWFPVIQYQAHTVQHTHAEVGATSAF